MSWPGLPILVRAAGRPVILVGEGDAADAKRRLLERAGVAVVREVDDARLAVVAVEDDDEALAAVARLRARGVLVNAVDRPDLCDFTLPAVVDRAPVLVAVMTGGASAGLAAALRQRVEAWLPARLGDLAAHLYAARGNIRARWPAAADRRRAIAAALATSGPLDLSDPASPDRVPDWLAGAAAPLRGTIANIRLRSADPDDLTLREARWLANADRVCHAASVPPAILDRARADAPRLPGDPPVDAPGLTVVIA